MEQTAWIILAILFAGLLLALIKGGWTGNQGAKDWFKAKFLGQTSSKAAGAAPLPAVAKLPAGSSGPPGTAGPAGATGGP